MSFTFTAEELAGLSEAQKDAIVDVVIAGVLADGKLDEKEVARAEQEYRRVPWGITDQAMDEKVQASLAKIQGFTTPDQAIELVKACAAKLTDANVREKTFALLARVMYADTHMTSEEKTVLTAFAMAFEIPVPRLTEIAESVKKGQ